MKYTKIGLSLLLFVFLCVPVSFAQTQSLQAISITGSQFLTPDGIGQWTVHAQNAENIRQLYVALTFFNSSAYMLQTRDINAAGTLSEQFSFNLSNHSLLGYNTFPLPSETLEGVHRIFVIAFMKQGNALMAELPLVVDTIVPQLTISGPTSVTNIVNASPKRGWWTFDGRGSESWQPTLLNIDWGDATPPLKLKIIDGTIHRTIAHTYTTLGTPNIRATFSGGGVVFTKEQQVRVQSVVKRNEASLWDAVKSFFVGQ